MTDHRFEDVPYSTQLMSTTVERVAVEMGDQTIQFVQYLLEPELVHLVHDDEQRLVVLSRFATGLL